MVGLRINEITDLLKASSKVMIDVAKGVIRHKKHGNSSCNVAFAQIKRSASRTGNKGKENVDETPRIPLRKRKRRGAGKWVRDTMV